MRSFTAAPQILSLVIATSASAIPSRSTGIEWGPCDLNATTPVACSRIPVPLDYTNTSSNTSLELELIKVAATHQPSKGSILFNFGGPGGDGYSNMAGLGDMLLEITGGYHDLVSFNPRGTDKTLTFSCFTNQSERVTAQLSRPGSLKTSSDVATGRLWAEGKVLADLCGDQLADIGSLVGTAFVARDMIEIVDALREDGLLRYWGFSYGTALGATVAAMFPDRVESVVLDAVLNPREFFQGYEVQRYTDADKTWRGFLEECVADPGNCILGQRNATAKQLEVAFWDLLESIKHHPIAVGGTIIDFTMMKTAMFTSLYFPSLWHKLAISLNAFLDNDLDTVASTIPELAMSLVIPNEASTGISCSDKTARASSLSEMLHHPAWAELDETTKWFSDSSYAIGATCSHWPFEAKGRYDGDFCANTRKPLLLIGNTYDPTTALAAAFNASAGFSGSVVLQHNGYGHQSWVQRSRCTDQYIREYFVNGTLPKPGTVCEPNRRVFDRD